MMMMMTMVMLMRMVMMCLLSVIFVLQWARYMKCDGSPDPTILPEINMYMSLWREDTENVSFDSVLKSSDLVLKVVGFLLSVISIHSMF